MRRIVLPIAAILACAAGFTGYYNWRVTGSPARMGYQVNRDTYGWPENLAFLQPKSPLVFDTGPGNCLIDEAMRIAYGKPYDRGGRTAASGQVDRRLLARLDHPWFRKPPPKSTGRELFSREFLLDRCGRELKRRPADVIATLTVLTAKTVGDAIARFVKGPLQEVIVSGGGMLNKTLMDQLEWTLWPAVPRPITVYGIHPLAKEPAAFALLAAETLRGRPGNLPSVTGARRAVVLGKVIR